MDTYGHDNSKIFQVIHLKNIYISKKITGFSSGHYPPLITVQERTNEKP